MPDDRDARLFALLEQLLSATRAGTSVDLQAVASAHPDLADELHDLWPLAQIAELGAQGDAVQGPAPSAPGTRFERFLLLGELGRGGMGVVYRARQDDLGREVALKMILKGAHATQVDAARFRAEASSAAKLDHPAILPVHEIGEHDGQLYFTTKLVEGGTLAQRLAAGPLAPREAATLLVPIARAIQHAHEHGVLHRDLKPSNILIDLDGRPYVADFGLARRLEGDASLTQSECLVGTPAYMAPEQAAGSRGTVSVATDVHGLGAVLYHALTGRPPFLGATPVETVMHALESEPTPPRLLQPRIDRDLEMITLKCLQKPVELRYRSAGELADDLERWLQNEPVAARSGRLWQVVGGLFRATHHAVVLENWGLLWMWHACVVFALCLVTFACQERGVTARSAYLALWGAGAGAWALVFWLLRRRAGPVTFVERQLAHLWGNSMFSCFLLLVIEWLLGLPALQLAPVIAVFSAGVFLGKAVLLGGTFYLYAGLAYGVAVPMALWPRFGMVFFGVTSFVSFFVPGWLAHRQRRP